MADTAVEAQPVADLGKGESEAAPTAKENGASQDPGSDAAAEKSEKAPDDAEKNRKGSRSPDRHRGDRYKSKGFQKTNRTKTDYSTLPESSDPAEIRKQVEFYFSDANLSRDKFLFSQIGGRKNLPVPVETIHSFKRMRRFQPVSVVIEALKSSSVLDIVEDDTAIQRKKPFEADADADQYTVQRQFEDEGLARSIYAKGFGEEKPTTQFDIEAFFADFGPTNQVRLRRLADKNFKGSVLVEFDSEETAKQFLETKPTPAYKGNPLEIMSKKEWLKRQARDRNDRRGGKDDRDWRTRREEDRKAGFPENRHKDGRDNKRYGGRRDRRDDKEEREDKAGKSEEGEKHEAAKDEAAPEKTEKRARDDEGDSAEQPAKRAKEDAEA